MQLRKKLHIVFGGIAKDILKQSGITNNEDSEIINFNDLLSLGPLCISNRQNVYLKESCGWIRF